MARRWRARVSFGGARLLILLCAGIVPVAAQQNDSATILGKVDAAVKARVDGIEGYTVTERYAVFRNKDENHPVAEMTVKTTYKQETGKSYRILSESGSALMRSLVLHAILDNEQHVNEPGVREGSWITTANYQMQVKQGGVQKMDGRDCFAIALTPRRKEPYLLVGTLWVDAKNGEIVKLEGKGSRSSSAFTGPTEMARQYVDIDGFGEATHARAESDSFLFGPTEVTIDYTGYQIQRRAGP
ncbi:MAG: hypothetical protein WA802_07760 [Terracidiphilus sp.]